MWRDLIIGEGNPLNSAWKAYEITGGPSISHNDVSYWIDRCVLGIGMTIMKSTAEGKELSALLESPDPEAIRSWLAAVVFRHCDPQLLSKRLADALEASFQAGQAAKAQELRECLGID